jgi:WD40 repeat protein
VGLTPDGSFALSGDTAGVIRMWELESGREVQVLEGHRGIVNQVVVTPDGRFAVSTSADQTLRIWCLRTGREMARYYPQDRPSVGTVALGTERIVCGCSDGSVHILSVGSLESTRSHQPDGG